MTGAELLEQKLLAMGATKQQVQSKVVPMVLSVIADNADIGFQAWEQMNREAGEARIAAYDELESARRQKARMMKEAIEEHERLIAENKAMQKSLEEMTARREELKVRLDEFETPEMRDRYRAAMLFESKAEAKTDYQKQTVANGLAAILSGGAVTYTVHQRSPKDEDFPTRKAGRYL